LPIPNWYLAPLFLNYILLLESSLAAVNLSVEASNSGGITQTIESLENLRGLTDQAPA
jgi:hypothetical protein